MQVGGGGAIVMQTVQHWRGDDGIRNKRIALLIPVRYVLLNTLMRSSRVAIFDEGGQDAAQVGFAEDQNVVETLFAHGAHPPFDESIGRFNCILGEGPIPVAPVMSSRTLAEKW